MKQLRKGEMCVCVCEREADRKKTNTDGGWVQERPLVIMEACLNCTVCTMGGKDPSVSRCMIKHAHTHRGTHTHTSSILQTLDCYDPFKSASPGSANHIAACARNPHRPGNYEVIWVEQAASVVCSQTVVVER